MDNMTKREEMALHIFVGTYQDGRFCSVECAADMADELIAELDRPAPSAPAPEVAETEASPEPDLAFREYSAALRKYYDASKRYDSFGNSFNENIKKDSDDEVVAASNKWCGVSNEVLSRFY